MKDALVILLLVVQVVAISGNGVLKDDPISYEDNHSPNNPRHFRVRREATKIAKLEIGTPTNILEANRGILDGLKEGDIQQTPESRNTLNDDYRAAYWNTKKIPIVLGSDSTLLTKAAVDEARREYELRTCLSFTDRTDEEDYLEIRVLGGCWSYVGVQGEQQTVSIGLGCEHMSVIVHEFMHAIGVWHEQSRADRDDYIEIKYEAISPDLAYNFDTHNFNESDDRRVPYDYDSVMHYGKYAFTEDGNVTIETRDPAFQDVIGQYSGFSEGDVTKISRMYGCSDTLRITNSVNFEEANAGGYSQVGLNTDVSWIKHDLGTSDTSGPTTKYLPKFDSTFGTDGTGSFMYLDTSRRIPGLSGAIKSMRYTTTVAHQCLEYSFFMKLNSGSSALMYVYLAEIDPVTGEIISYGSALRTHNSHTTGQDVWWVERMTISAPSSYKIIFWAKTGSDYSDIIAVDDVTIVDKECDTSFFQVAQYSELLSVFEVDDFFASPVMYTGHPGYAYQLVVYPNGLQSAVDLGWQNDMGVFFRLIGGDYDDELVWPFDKQFVRMVVTDQGPNPLTRMNYYLNFMTDNSSSLAEAYQKPTSLGVPNLSIGWSAFMSNNMLATRKYLKHGAAYFSVQVTDMRPYESTEGISAKLSNPVLEGSFAKAEMRSYDAGVSESESPAHEKEYHENMVTVGIAAIITLVVSGIVLLVMSVVICVVARSYRSHSKAVPYSGTDSGYNNSSSFAPLPKYYDDAEKV